MVRIHPLLPILATRGVMTPVWCDTCQRNSNVREWALVGGVIARCSVRSGQLWIPPKPQHRWWIGKVAEKSSSLQIHNCPTSMQVVSIHRHGLLIFSPINFYLILSEILFALGKGFLGFLLSRGHIDHHANHCALFLFHVF